MSDKDMQKVENNEKDHEEQEDRDEQMADKQNSQTQQIIETGAVTPTGGKHVIHCLTIVGQVEGHYTLPPQNKTTKYEHVIPQLVAIQESPTIKGLVMILNTVGGDVEAGLAIAELVAGLKKPTVSLVLGGGHSIGVPLAVATRKSFIAPSATMTIHPVRMNGVVLGVPQTLSYFDRMQERIVNFVEDNSNIKADAFRKLMMNTGELVMDVGTILNGKQAVEEGLIDSLGGLSDVIECLYEMIEQDEADNEQAEKTKQDIGEKRKHVALKKPKKIRTTGEKKKSRHVTLRVVSPPQRQVPTRTHEHSKRRRGVAAASNPAALIQAHSYLPQIIHDIEQNSMHTKESPEHTMFQQMARDMRHVSRTAEKRAAQHSQAAPHWNGGGERNRVNPFGHSAPHAD